MRSAFHGRYRHKDTGGAPSLCICSSRMLLSDGSHYMQGMLGTQLNHFVSQGHIVNNSIVRVSRSSVNELQGRRFLIVLSVEVVAPPPPVGRIGTPRPIEDQSTGDGYKPEPHYGGVSAPAPSAMGRGPVASTATNHHVFPIASLNPYSNRWTIKARVTKKSDIRTWSNSRGEGKLFSVELLDDQGTEIRGTFFKEAVDKFYELIHQDSVYFFSGGRLKTANRKYTSVQNDYEITFGENATVEPCQDDRTIKHVQFNFTPISRLERTEPNQTIDVIGVVQSVGERQEFTTKAGKNLVKRDLALVDQSGTAVTMTLWGDRADEFSTAALENQVVGFKGAKLTDFGGRSLSAFSSTLVDTRPNVGEARELQQWWETAGQSAKILSISSTGGPGGSASGGGGSGGPIANINKRHTMSQIQEEGLGQGGEQSDIITVKGAVGHVLHSPERPPWYAACPMEKQGQAGRQCFKKVTQNLDHSWVCEVHGQVTEPLYRYVLPVSVCDHTGSHLCTMFGDEAERFIGQPAGTMREKLEHETQLSPEHGAAAWARDMDGQKYRVKYFTIRVKMEMVQDDQRIKCSIMKMRDVDFAYESERLLDGIKQYIGAS